MFGFGGMGRLGIPKIGGGGFAGLLNSSPSPLGTGPTVREFAEVVAKGGAGGDAAPVQGLLSGGAEQASGGMPGLLSMFGGQDADQMQQLQTLMRLFGGR